MQMEWQASRPLEQSVIWTYTVCPGLSVQNNRIITVHVMTLKKNEDIWFFSVFKEQTLHYWINKSRIFTSCLTTSEKYHCWFSALINLHLPNVLFHPYQLDESIFHLTIVNWCLFFHFYPIFYRNSCEQTVQAQIKRLILFTDLDL